MKSFTGRARLNRHVRHACALLLLVLASTALPMVSAQTGSDQRIIVFTAAVIVDGFDIERGGIFLMRPDGSSLTQLTSFSTLNYDFAEHGLNLPDDHPSVSPNGTQVAFTSDRETPNNWEIYLMSVNGSNVRRLTFNSGLDSEPTWSPDGSTLAFASERNGKALDIYTMNTNGGALKQITTDAKEDLEPAFSPDGGTIAFSRVLSEGEKDVFLIDSDGTDERVLRIQPGEDHDPTWSPDGSELVISSEIAGTAPFGDTWRVRVSDGTYLQNITTSLPHGGGDPAWSPDGSQVVLFASTTSILQSPMQLWRVNANGSGAFAFERKGFLNVHPNWGKLADSDQDGRPDYLEQANETITERTLNGEVEAGDRFGTALALADINHDGYRDLFVGAPGEDIRGVVLNKEDTGAVYVGLGFPIAGFTNLAANLNVPSQLTLPSGSEENANFGKSMAACDFNGDGFDDLAVAAVGFNTVSIYLGVNQAQTVSIASGSLGAGLAAGDFNNDGKCDLAAGAPNATRGGFTSGAVYVYRGTSSGLNPSAQIIDQSMLGDLGDAGGLENLDSFGATLAAGDLNSDGADDLVVSALNEDYGGLADVGLVHSIPGQSGIGLNLSQTTSRGVMNLPAPYNLRQSIARFGESLAIGDFDGDLLGVKDLVVGVPGQDISGIENVGMLAVFKGLVGGGLLQASGSVIEASQLGVARTIGSIGQSLVVGDFSGDSVDDLAASAPLAGPPAQTERGVVYLILGSRGTSGSCKFCIGGGVGSSGGGLKPATVQTLTHSQMGGLNAAQGDHFGAAFSERSTQTLAAGDIDQDGQDDLFIGIPDRDASGLTDSGALSVRYGVKVGESLLSPTAASIQAGQPISLTLDWTHPNNWHDLDQLHLRLRNQSGEVAFWARFDEPSGTFLLYDPATESFFGAAAGATAIENSLGMLDLTQSAVIGSGPAGRSVRLIFGFQLKTPTAGTTYMVELLASDDSGNSQGFDEAGALSVGPFDLWLPLISAGLPN